MGMLGRMLGKAFKAAKGEAKRTVKAKVSRKCRRCGKRYSNPLTHTCRMEFKRAQAPKVRKQVAAKTKGSSATKRPARRKTARRR